MIPSLWRLAALAIFAWGVTSASADPGDIVFVTQPPLPNGFGTVNATFGNHEAAVNLATRGGDLWIRYADGTLKNLTQAAGFGQSGRQGAQAIAVRDPAVHWSGAKVIFSMAVGAPSRQYEVLPFRWQLYEIAGLRKGETPVITKVPFQPVEYNNVTPAYGSDDRIIFASDRPFNGAAHLYPQRDEYESANIVSGLWRLDPTNGDLVLLDHSPSGDFSPFVDSFGRIVFTRWDHLQRDQQKDAGTFGAFDYPSEAADASPLAAAVEVFPEVRAGYDPEKKPFEELHTINQFVPWMSNQDGTDLETLNHLGRQEFGPYFNRSRNDDPNLREGSSGGIRTASDAFHQMAEDPLRKGRYLAIASQEFGTHSAGQIIALDAPPSKNPDLIRVEYVTHEATRGTTASPSPNHTGLYRNPLPLSNGGLVAVHTSSTLQDSNIGTSSAPRSRYDFRLKSLVKNGELWQAGEPLTPGIRKSVSYWNPDSLVTYDDVQLWELQPVELLPRPVPPLTGHSALQPPERAMFQEAGVTEAELVQYLKSRNLALIVSRNVTTRDASDKQQPFNLRVAGSSTATTGATGKLYDVSHLQIFQGDLIRGYGGPTNPRPGRRVLARALHDPAAANPEEPGAPLGAVRIGADGSMAAFVPARRALTWQLTDPAGQGIVRERYWLTFQPGEIRMCGSCHGVNSFDQAGQPPPVNPPQALKSLLQFFTGIPRDPVPPNPGGPGSPGTVSIGVEGPRSGAPLRGGGRFTATVEAPANGAVSVTLSSGGVACASPAATVTVGATGRQALRGTIRRFRGRASITFTARLGSTATEASIVKTVRGEGGRSAAAEAMCRVKLRAMPRG